MHHQYLHSYVDGSACTTSKSHVSPSPNNKHNRQDYLTHDLVCLAAAPNRSRARQRSSRWQSAHWARGHQMASTIRATHIIYRPARRNVERLLLVDFLLVAWVQYIDDKRWRCASWSPETILSHKHKVSSITLRFWRTIDWKSAKQLTFVLMCVM